MAGDPRRPGRRRRRRDPAPVSGMLERYLRGRGAGRGPVAAAPAGMETLTAAWRAVAGRDAAGSLPLRRTRNGIVTVACADAGIAHALSAREDDLVDALRAATGEQVRGLRCVVADHALPPAEDAPPLTTRTAGRPGDRRGGGAGRVGRGPRAARGHRPGGGAVHPAHLGRMIVLQTGTSGNGTAEVTC